MPPPKSRPQSGLEPAPAWTVLTDAPLKGLSLAREAGTILAWDEREHLYLIDPQGGHRAVAQAPDRIVAAAISDDGNLAAVIGEGARLWAFGPELELVVDRQAPPEPSALAVDSHGRYIAVGSRLGQTQLYTRNGRQAGRFETRQPLAHLVFVPGLPLILGAATYGMLACVELRPAAGGPGRLDADVSWQESLMSNVGRLTTSGDGGMILTSCFTHGVQRYDLEGRNEGSYHLGGTAAHAVPDFVGRIIAVSTLEGELAVLGASGNVRWKTTLPRPVIALETDALGRYLVYGHSTGEVVRLDLERSDRPASRARKAAKPARPVSATLRTPDWSVPVATTDDQAQTSVLAVLDQPPRIGLITSTSRLQVFSAEGQQLGQTVELAGVGRFLRTAPGWLAAATDRQVILYDAKRNTGQRLDMSLVEITQLAVLPDTYGVAIVQEHDRLGRATLAGRWIWRKEIHSLVEDVAIGPDGLTAVTTDDGRLRILDLGGEPAGEFPGDPNDPLFLITAPQSSPPLVAWLTLARRAQVLRGHDRVGRVIWETPVPWEGWHFLRLGAYALVSAPDGRAAAYNGAGELRDQSRSSGEANDAFGNTRRGDVCRVSRQGVHLICSNLTGGVNWRTVAEGALGPIAVGQAGVAALIGRSLAWFRAGDS